ncbi:hypothetical protein BYT27DRAFT_7243689 [Phlegmacium glaucopus]|nr:hypothetical protein BYT27DRAFT_7243689 [Phlegmacium glaucopus]
MHHPSSLNPLLNLTHHPSLQRRPVLTNRTLHISTMSHTALIRGLDKAALTREWRADCWKRLNPQMRAAEKRLADLDKNNRSYSSHIRKKIQRLWASYVGQLFEGVEKPNSAALSATVLRKQIKDYSLIPDIGDIHLRMEKEIEDTSSSTEFRLKRGSELGQLNVLSVKVALSQHI